MKEVIIVGSGPAGISAALYTARAGHKTTVISKDRGALERAHTVENYYGFAEPISGEELYERALLGARRQGVTLLTAEVTSLTLLGDGRFHLTAGTADYTADGVILATGAERRLPALPGIREFFGRGVSTCAICDSFAARRREVAVLGAGELALHEAEALLGVAASVTLLTNGEEPAVRDPRFAYDTRPVAAIEGDTAVRAVRFFDGEPLPVSMVFSAVGVAGASRLAATLGLVAAGEEIRTDKDGATAIPHLYAVGDCTGGLLQIATAVGDGARAGAALAAALKRT